MELSLDSYNNTVDYLTLHSINDLVSDFRNTYHDSRVTTAYNLFVKFVLFRISA